MRTESFGAYQKYILEAGRLSASVTDLGAIALSVRFGGTELTLGYRTPEEYLAGGYIGCPVGRYANRIGGAAFRLNGTDYSLTANEGRNQLHGGLPGVHKQRWTAEATGEREIRFGLTLPDGENGFPGTLSMGLTYRLSEEALTLIFEGESDRDTVYNPTTHIFWTLGAPAADALRLGLRARQVLPVDGEKLPAGAPVPAEGDFDFTEPRSIGPTVIDHCFIPFGNPVCVLESDALRMTLETDYPGLQIYTGDGLASSGFRSRAGIALEPEFWPDSPNHPEFPSALLRAGTRFRKVLTYRFAER